MSDEPYSVYKALADPTRRKLLDLMQNGPRTTGELVDIVGDDMSRFGVMKHLGVLERAGLVVVRRKGRQRYNHLNAVPIRRIYERWVGKYAGATAASLIHLKALAESQHGEQPMSIDKNDDGKKLGSFHIVQEIEIAASRAKVWDALTKDIGKWWAFRTIEIDKGVIALDARVGGHFSETFGDDGAVWGTVMQLRVGHKLMLQGPLGLTETPTHSLYSYELEERGEGTLLKLTHQCFGLDLGDAADKYNHGWELLLNTYLKAFLEQGKTCGDVKAEQAAD